MKKPFFQFTVYRECVHNVLHYWTSPFYFSIFILIYDTLDKILAILY